MSTSSVRSLAIAVVVTVAVVGGLFLASTWGIAAWSQSRTPGSGGVGALPVTIDHAPPSVGTTAQYGPVGAVSLVYAGTEVEDGLTGTVDHPWLAVSAQTGGYRALDAPALPGAQPGAIAVSATGDRLAWATGDGVEVYDTTTGEAREVALPGASRVGHFSPDGSMLTAHAGGLVLLDLEGGGVLAEAEGTDAEVVARAAWRADDSAVDYVDGEELVTLPADGTPSTTQPSPYAADAELAWAPTGEQLVALQEDAKGVLGLVTAPAAADGTLGRAEPVDTSGVSVQEMLGFSGDDTVAVSAYLLESGDVERVLDISLAGGSPVDLTTLPTQGENWQGSATLAASSAALRSGSTDYGERRWPWSYRARLAGCTLLGLFGLGLWVTRRRRRRTRA